MHFYSQHGLVCGKGGSQAGESGWLNQIALEAGGKYQFAALMKSDYVNYGKVIRTANIKLE